MSTEPVPVDSDRPLDYATYLRLAELLSLQTPLSQPEHPDEMHFIVTHQAIELWFCVLANDVRRARGLVDTDELGEATTVLRRACCLVEAIVAQMGTLRALPPESFHQFRPYLGAASGLQSAQFRELELLSGHRSRGYLTRLRRMYGDGAPDQIEAALAEHSLADAHLAAAARRGVTNWAAFYADHSGQRELHELSEVLVDYDDAWRRWRSEHLAIVFRMLGNNVLGTAGTDMSFLARRVHHRFFPYLWEARIGLATLAGGRTTQESTGWT
jgi:tryptophan 2,3-dioxygenase